MAEVAASRVNQEICKIRRDSKIPLGVLLCEPTLLVTPETWVLNPCTVQRGIPESFSQDRDQYIYRESGNSVSPDVFHLNHI